MNSSTSAIADLHKAIESCNPFDRPHSVRSHDVWEQNFPDVPSINAHVSDAIFQGIEKIRSGQRQVLGITIRAESGLGKSHLISRIRHRLKEEGDSFFVYMVQENYSDLNRINSLFLNTLSSSLKQVGGQGVTQWQELATALVNSVYKSEVPPQQIVDRFPNVLAKNPEIISDLTEKICSLKSNIQDPYVVQAILWTLSSTKGLFAMNWLAGKDLAQAQADAMGLPNASEDERESRALGLAGQTLDLMGDHRNIVICFDEVEPKNCNSKGLTTPQVVALLAKDLYSQLKRGVLMMAIFPATWASQVKDMPQAESVVDRIGEKILDLKYLNADNLVALVSSWLEEFYRQQRLIPPNSLYPFNESELRQFGDEKPLVRDILKWCRNNWNIPGTASTSDDTSNSLHDIETAFKEQLSAIEQQIDDYMEDSDLIADALHFGFYSIIGQTIGLVHVEDIEEVDVKSADRGYLDFRIVGRENEKQVKIVVSVAQSSSAKFVSATLKRLIDYKKFDMTRGCLVRSKSVKPGTHGHEFLNQLLSKQGGEWVLLKADDIKPLLAISLVFDACEEYGFTEEQVIEFMQQNKIAEKNYLINEILSDPSGQIPDNAVDEDDIIAQEESMAKEFAAVVSGKSEPNKASSIDELLMVIGS